MFGRNDNEDRASSFEYVYKVQNFYGPAFVPRWSFKKNRREGEDRISQRRGSKPTFDSEAGGARVGKASMEVQKIRV